MILNIVGILVLGTLAYYAVNRNQSSVQNIPFNTDVSKSRSLVNKNSDSSMYTELLRRRSIQRVGRVKPQLIRESKTQFGSMTGYLETFIITGIGNLGTPQNCPKDIIYDGGNQFDNFCPIPGTGILDAGNNNTRVCGV